MTLARHTSPPVPARINRIKAAEEERSAERNARAVMTVASHANDHDDCCELLAMLGLDAKPRGTGWRAADRAGSL